MWPELGWDGRIQQMLHGHAQQSQFVWSFQWPDLAAWEEAQAAAALNPAYREWAREVAALLGHGDRREAFRIVEGSDPADSRPGRIEVRSTYCAPVARLGAARDLMSRALGLDGWDGQNQEMIMGTGAPGTFVWSSTWDNLGQWEAAMAAGDDDLEAWFADWVAVVDYGSRREILRNL